MGAQGGRLAHLDEGTSETNLRLKRTFQAWVEPKAHQEAAKKGTR